MARKHLVAIACGSLLALPAIAQAANLLAGNYEVSSYYKSSNATGGGTCAFPTGTALSSVYFYPGPAKPGAASQSFINDSTFQLVFQVKFPTTPAAGANTWSGAVTDNFLPGGTPSNGTFSSNFTVLNTKSYIATTTYIFPAEGGGTCTSVVREVGIFTAKP